MSPYFILAERALPLTQTCHSDYKIRNTYQHHFLWEVLGPKKGGQWPIKDWPFDLISKATVMHRGKCLLSYLPHLEGKHFTLLLLMDLWVQYHFYPTEKGVILTLNLEWGPPPKKKPVYLKEDLLEITNPRDLRRVWMCTPAQQPAKRMTWAWQMGEEANLQSCRPALQQSLSVHTKTQTTKQHLENVYIIFLLLQHNGKYTQDNLKSNFQKHILENHTNKYVKTIYRKVPSPETSP